jgi:ketosteroid isomerase-like protein
MNQQKNVETVRQNYAAVGRGEIPALLTLLSDEIEWSMAGPSVIPWTGTRRGRQQVAEFFVLLGKTLEFQRFEPREFIAQGDTVVVIGYERSLVKPTGRTFEQEWAHVYTLRDGKISRCRIFEDTAAQVAAFGRA